MINAIFWIAILYVAITGIWRRSELIIYREVTPRIIDDFVAILFATSLYYNLI